MWVEPIRLCGEAVTVEPLEINHAGALLAAARDPSIWLWMPVNPSGSPEAMEAWIETALAERERGDAMPFTIVDSRRGVPIGSTRYLEIAPADRRLEIGWTWLSAEAQRTAVNTECKYLLLRHAFESLGAIRVQFKTDSRNLRSQRAMERIGCVKEGVLRNHRILPDGYIRDSVYYSILDREWPSVRQRLLNLMSRQGNEEQINAG